MLCMSFLRPLSRLIWSQGVASLGVMLGLLGSLVGLLAESASVSHHHSDDDDGPFQYGVPNYRTRKLDDGTDPYGWYDPD